MEFIAFRGRILATVKNEPTVESGTNQDDSWKTDDFKAAMTPLLYSSKRAPSLDSTDFMRDIEES